MFNGVYLLVSNNPKYKGNVYIGYTVNPKRRITQHNNDEGANRTKNRGPWKMILIVHGFPNNISALKFEWNWQYPKFSRKLKEIQNLSRRNRKESHFDYNFRILSELLQIGPWNRLPLCIRWITEEYFKEFPSNKKPPIHMITFVGNVVLKKNKFNIEKEMNEINNQKTFCCICLSLIKNKSEEILCANKKCIFIYHLFCIAKLCLKEKNQYIPINGNCPKCNHHFLWGDIIMQKKGYKYYLEDDDCSSIIVI